MRYVVCHGEVDSGAGEFVSKSKIALFVRNFGDPLPQMMAPDILGGRVHPTRWLEQGQCPELRLTAVKQHEWFALSQAMGADLGKVDPYFVGADTSLSQLVEELGEDELRMVCCTDGGGAVTHQSDLVEPSKAEERMRRLVKARRESAARAHEVIAGLGEGSRAFWLGDYYVYAIMTEWAIDALPPVEDKAESWVDTLSYLLARPELAKALFEGSIQAFPGFGAGTRDRINRINGYLGNWPDCVHWFRQIYNGDESMYAAVREYLENPFGDARIADYNTIFQTELWPVCRRVAAVIGDNLESWHRYLAAVDGVAQENWAALPLLVDLAGYNAFFVHNARSWTDFNRTWELVTASYPNTVAKVLRASADPTLQGLIARYQPAPEAPDDEPIVGYVLYCAHCRDDREHEPVDTVEDQVWWNCAGCGQAIGQSADTRTFLCSTCETVAVYHRSCWTGQ